MASTCLSVSVHASSGPSAGVAHSRVPRAGAAPPPRRHGPGDWIRPGHSCTPPPAPIAPIADPNAPGSGISANTAVTSSTRSHATAAAAPAGPAAGWQFWALYPRGNTRASSAAAAASTVVLDTGDEPCTGASSDRNHTNPTPAPITMAAAAITPTTNPLEGRGRRRRRAAKRGVTKGGITTDPSLHES